MPEKIDQVNGSRPPSDSSSLAGNLTPAQRQFAEVLGNCLAEQWRRTHTTPQKDASDRSEQSGSANDKTGD